MTEKKQHGMQIGLSCWKTVRAFTLTEPAGLLDTSLSVKEPAQIQIRAVAEVPESETKKETLPYGIQGEAYRCGAWADRVSAVSLRLRTFSVLEKFSRCHNLWIFHAGFQKIFIAGK